MSTAVATRQRDRAGLLSPLRRKARIPPSRLDPNHLGARHRRGDLLHPGQRLPSAQPPHPGDLEGDTILGGVAFLYTSGSWPLALIVLVASVMIPLGKLVALSYLLVTVQRGSVKDNRDRLRLYRM